MSINSQNPLWTVHQGFEGYCYQSDWYLIQHQTRQLRAVKNSTQVRYVLPRLLGAGLRRTARKELAMEEVAEELRICSPHQKRER